MKNDPKANPVSPDKITNSDESRKLPGTNIEVSAPQEADEFDSHYEGVQEAGNIAALDEDETDNLDGSNANNLRTK